MPSNIQRVYSIPSENLIPHNYSIKDESQPPSPYTTISDESGSGQNLVITKQPKFTFPSTADDDDEDDEDEEKKCNGPQTAMVIGCLLCCVVIGATRIVMQMY